jgi:membrane protease YdiL (CAAX protease family)
MDSIKKLIETIDVRLTIGLVVAVLVLTLDYYNTWLPYDSFEGLLRAEAFEGLIFYLAIPLGLIALFGDSPADYGLRLGDWRAGLRWSLLSALVAVPILYIAATTPEMASYYSRSDRSLLEILLVSAGDLLGWEFFFRGFLLFLLARLVGPNAILLQAVPFALAHLGKPQLETITTIFGGAYFGWIAWRTRSFAYPFLLHWLINVTVRLAALGLLPF